MPVVAALKSSLTPIAYPTMAAENQLPVELMEQIITTAWHMPLSSTDRITFMQSSMLVNLIWADRFDFVSSRDVYIPSSAFCDHLIQRLQAPAASAPPSSFLASFLRRYKGQSKRSMQPRLACQFITIQIANADVHPDKNSRVRLPMGAVLDDLLETLDACSLAPNLRCLSIEYLDAGFDDVFHRVGLAALPSQITHLELRYSFSAETPIWLVEALREKQERQRHIGWISRSVMNLSVIGAGQNTVSDLLRSCSNVQTLKVVRRFEHIGFLIGSG
ncbi:hypothetical protein B0H17DRAFT_1285102 [Mycena rosella]|uniref:Uncharacterized protein n=1 Tax=Mycena rosella TaxID=1033263 RepID=A0AAD7DI23_MYCRO|nr:hypothetical protein B0H17DRAFT_1285102 [Mycena rosella]